MPGDNPLVPNFPDGTFIVFIVLFVVVGLAIVGGGIATAVTAARRARSGQPLDVQSTEPHTNSFRQNQAMQNLAMQDQLMQNQLLQNQLTQQQLLQQQTQAGNIVGGP